MLTNSSSPKVEEGRRGSLVASVRWAFLLFAIVLLVVVGTTLTFWSYQAQQQALSQSQHEISMRVAEAISYYLQARVQEMLLFDHARGLAALDVQEQQQALESLLSYRGDVLDEITLLDSEGTEIIKVSEYRTYLPAELTSQANTPQFEATSRGDNFIGSVYLSQYSLPMVTVAVPVHDKQGQVSGALLAEVSVRQMWEAVAKIKLGETGYAYIVDKSGSLLAHTTLAAFFAHRGENLSNVPAVKEALTEGREKAPVVYTDFTGESVTSAYAPIEVENIQWLVVVAVPVNEAYASIYSMLLSLGGVLAVTLVLASVVGSLIPRAIIRPLNLLEEGASIIGAGNLDHRIEIRSRNEIGRLAQAFNNMAAQLQDLISSLEQRVAERTHELERRAIQLEAASQVARDAATFLDPDELLQRTVELIRERFDYYQVSIFLLDDRREHAVLRAATGEAGQQLMAQDFKLEVGVTGMVGHVAATGQPRIAWDVSEDRTYLGVPLLPDTRSEIALPLQVRGLVLGVLDVQSTQVGAFTDEDIAVLQILADQVAVALDKARLFAESQQALEASRRAYAAVSREAWIERARARADLGYRRDGDGLSLAGSEWRPQMKAALRTGETTLGQGDDATTLTVPVKVLGEVIGVVDARKPDGAGEWTAEEVALLETLTDQLSATLVSARLFEDTQRRARDEEQLRTITAQVRDAPDLDAVLQTTVQEIARALGVERAFVQLGAPPPLESRTEE